MLKRSWIQKLSDFREGATFLRRWGLIGILIGIGSGIGALALNSLIQFFNHYILTGLIGYTPPLPGGEGAAAEYTLHMSRPWLLPIVTTAVGLVGGLLVWKLAPETAGIGTNAAIRAFHANERLKIKTSLLKLLTSALTIGGGLTSGREGPIAQIGAATGPALQTRSSLLLGNGTSRWQPDSARASPPYSRPRSLVPSSARRFFTPRISKWRLSCPALSLR